MPRSLLQDECGEVREAAQALLVEGSRPLPAPAPGRPPTFCHEASALLFIAEGDRIGLTPAQIRDNPLQACRTL